MIRSPDTSLLPLFLPLQRPELPLPLPLPPPPLPVHPSAALICLPLILAFLMFIGGKRSVRVVQWSEWSYVTAQWSEWGLWSSCSSTCFGTPGVRIRTHTCPTNPPTCQGETSELEACAGEFPCEIS